MKATANASKHPTKTEVTVVIPMYNEVARLTHSFLHWAKGGLFDQFSVILVDDGSIDETPQLARKLSSQFHSCRFLALDLHRSKYNAISRALAFVQTPYVLCLDADTWFSGKAEMLAQELERLMALEVDVAAFRLEPCGKDGSLIVDLQVAEYAFFTDAARRAFDFVGNVNGAAAFWRTCTLRQVVAHHSLLFEGDDLEATLIAQELGARVVPSPLLFRKFAKPSLRALVCQRMRIWDVGLLNALTRRPPLRRANNKDTLFFQWYAVYEALLHPAKVSSMIILIISFFAQGVQGTWLGGIKSLLIWTYLITACFCFALWLLSAPSKRSTYRLLGILIIYALYPTIHLYVPQNYAYFVGCVSWWYIVSLFYSFAISDPTRSRRSLRIAAIIPVYFLFLTIIVRTAGFVIWTKRLYDRSKVCRSELL
jgi:glycosyltransferase involved in cell wall biosynthesis